MCEKENLFPLGLLIKKAREDCGLLQEDLGIAVGISPRHMARIENGTRQPSLRVLRKIVEILHISVEPYFYPESKPQKSTLDRQIEHMLGKLNDVEKSMIAAMINVIVKAKEEEKV